MKARFTAATMVALCLLYVLIVLNPQNASAGQPQGSSQLQIVGKDGKVTGFVPLKHTGIKTEISGFVARIEVTQEFENVLPDAVEAVYVFPLPHDSAVDGMTMTVGGREIHAVIKERDEARKIFEQARSCRPHRRIARPGAPEHLHPVSHQHSAQRQSGNQALSDRAAQV